MMPLVAVALVIQAALSVDPSIHEVPDLDPLAPARSGMVQCYDPDRASRSCRAMFAYHRARDGGWSSLTTVMPDPAQPLTITVTSGVVVRDGAVCNTLRRGELLGAQLRFFDRQVPADRALPVLVQIADRMAGVIDREVCTRTIAVPGGLVARAQMTGAATPLPDQPMIWVRADAGYGVRPRGAAANGG